MHPFVSPFHMHPFVSPFHMHPFVSPFHMHPLRFTVSRAPPSFLQADATKVIIEHKDGEFCFGLSSENICAIIREKLVELVAAKQNMGDQVPADALGMSGNSSS
jgi:hypothetical protein